jgi:hypothetical protein
MGSESTVWNDSNNSDRKTLNFRITLGMNVEYSGGRGGERKKR